MTDACADNCLVVCLTVIKAKTRPGIKATPTHDWIQLEAAVYVRCYSTHNKTNGFQYIKIKIKGVTGREVQYNILLTVEVLN